MNVPAISLASLLAIKARVALPPDGATLGNFIGATCLCGIGYTVALLLADQAFAQDPESAIAKMGVLLGSTFAALLGATILATTSRRHPVTAASS